VRPTAWSGATERATKVACCSSTLSSIEVPNPSFRISTPNSFAEAAAPYSFGGRDRDVEGQSLVGVPGQSDFFEALDFLNGKDF
jgi:hypothetical protein